MKYMVKIIGNDIMRGTTKVGWVTGNDVFDEEGRKLGYFSDNDIYDENGKKIAYTENNNLKTLDGRTMRLDENRKHVLGGSASDLERAAIYLLIGD